MNNTEQKEQIKAWLEHPYTQLFKKALENKRKGLYQEACEYTYQAYFRNDKSETATLYFGKVDGFDTILGLLERCQEQIREENKNPEQATYDDIEELLREAHGS